METSQTYATSILLYEAEIDDSDKINGSVGSG